MAKQQELFDSEPAPWELDEGDDRLIATIVLPEAPFGPFDYAVPEALRSSLGPAMRVRVPLGRSNRTVIGYCVRVANQVPSESRSHRLKDVQSLVDHAPLLATSMLRLTEWMSEYYLCPWGQVLEAVVPAGVRHQAGTREVTYLSVPTNVAARLTQLKLPRKQAEALRMLAASARPLTVAELSKAAKCTAAPIKELQRKALVRSDTCRELKDFGNKPTVERDQSLQLNAEQQIALSKTLDALNSQRAETILIFGVTGSGKTEVYMQAIDEVVSFGRQAIVLVPEISLTPQTVSRFRSRFDRVAVLHSHLSNVERNAQWREIASGRVQVVVGARSAIFAPTPHLGLIVIDEEHDSSFKQDSLPRYHARDVALQRAKMESVPVVLGSATPSLESWSRAKHGEFQLVELENRILDRPLPHVGTIDLRTEYQSRKSRGAISRPLHQSMTAALKDQGQIILLLNRRGFSTSIQCPSCGEVVKCPDCDIALTHHREGEKAVCHYCDFQIIAPPVCPSCQFEGIRYAGLGTQRLEAEVRARFGEARVLRMDSDTMQKPGSHEQAFAKFRAGEIDILVGTQMIAKGLDFPNVTLVGVINADTALHFPDFRASERTFQLVTQVAGRTGRGERGGHVLVQTFSPEHPAIIAATKHDYRMFADQELPIRDEYGYPPASSMMRGIIRGPSERMTETFAEHLCEEIQRGLDEQYPDARLLGPSPAPISKLRGKFRIHFLLFGQNVETLRNIVRETTATAKPPEDVQWVLDVDSLDML
ncbi:MAG: primosomal protein N' [Planctomycetes bacterium]|nr:primosomal protein N' [Planctomycetota bacterium]